jgi:NAD(P)-dependent dehydrogenase (short-subunit alcohol dehydrogenase family)
MDALEQKVAVVTGAASGIGKATAALFAAEGAKVIAVDLHPDHATEAAAWVDGVAVAGSVSDPATWEAVVSAATDLGGIDLAHLNAGVFGYVEAIEDLPLDLYDRTIGTNISGVVLGVRALVPLLRARGGGAIVATASVAGIVPFAPNPLYTLTKQAVTGFVCALAPNLVGDGISFDAVCPGVVDTPMTVGALQGADPASMGFTLISPETIAQNVLALATTEGTGRCRAVLPGQDPIDWAFPGWGELSAPRG